MSWQGAPRLKDRLRTENTAELAQKLGVDYTTVLHWQAGRRAPKADMLAALCRELGVSADWILGLPERVLTPAVNPPAQGEWELIPRVTEQVAAGEAIYDESAIPDRNFYCFRRGYVKHLIGDRMEPGRLVLVPVARGPRGESMMPTIRPGALVMIDRGPGAAGWNEVEHGGIYLVRPEDEGVTLKRVVRAGARALVIFGDNPEQPPRPIEVAKGESMNRYVLGRVRWIGQEVV